MQQRARDWLAQAENDLLWARDSLSAGHFGGACFVAQQAAEKALKSVAYGRGADLVRGHSVMELSEELGLPAPLREGGARLDQYYVSTRYPDSVPAGAPYRYFTEQQAREALDLAQRFVQLARTELGS